METTNEGAILVRPGGWAVVELTRAEVYWLLVAALPMALHALGPEVV